MDAVPRKPSWLLGIMGGILGGVAGYFAFIWIGSQGFYAIALPGAAVGFGCSLLSKGQSRTLGIICAILALPLGLFGDWRLFSPFVDDDGLDKGFGYYLFHMNELQPITFIMIALGVALAYWIGKGQADPAKPTGPDT